MTNKIPETPDVKPGPQHRYQLTVTDLETGETIYQNQGHAGSACFVEKVTAFGPNPEGIHQIFCWGNPVMQFYAVDQLQRWFRENGFPETMAELERRGFIHANFDIGELFQKGRD